MKKILLVTGLAVMLSACSSTSTTAVSQDAQITQDWSVDKLYAEAHEEMESRNYSRSVRLYEILRARFPNTRQAVQSRLDTAYVYYKDEQQPQALAHVEQFLKLYPNHPNTDYALYLKGLIVLNQDKSIFNKLASQDWSDRDPKANREAYQVFNELITLFPDSKYANDAREKMTRLVDALGGNEMAIARYYMQRGAYLAAANRAQGIVSRYQNTRYVEEALAIMMTAYTRLEKPELSNDTRRVLAQNFPQSPYLQKEWQPDDIPWWRYWK
ncbi:competence protein ComL [Eikenella sp. NML96-A-049]|uniref:outer membrane protein assembly factor BamD n=1 Tax=unclassified Eikenella TaxID=2639367 RepID=UPI0007E277DB|nr:MULTISPECIES: outer membrane protein assembly factor BamD [unclassified Eikenella]OAM34559.1 competence protein ComL [Eikenella sp. NML070372]OAM39299.1 competence protein ComL [Eikenella sp. NML96-A-049]